jgi:hypothetical protein
MTAPKCKHCGHEAPPPFPGEIIYVPIKKETVSRYSLKCPICEKTFIYPAITHEEIHGKKEEKE